MSFAIDWDLGGGGGGDWGAYSIPGVPGLVGADQGGFGIGLPPSSFGFDFNFGSTGGGGGVDSGFPGGGINIDIPVGTGGGGGSRPSLNQTLTQIVDSFERQLKANLAAWQAQAISSGDAIARGWNLMDSMVAAVAAYGAQGLKAAAERDRRVDPSQLRWDWAAYYIDPISGGLTSAQPPLPNIPTNTTPTTNTGYPAPYSFFNDPLILGIGLLLLFLVARR